MNNTLVIIPARGGSKGIPHKNIKDFNGKPLICYSTDLARSLFESDNICVSTDDLEIKEIVEKTGLIVPFLRPAYLALDNSSTEDVILHALDFYKDLGKVFDKVLLLQPTSPLRNQEDIIKAYRLYNDSIDMVVSVKKSHAAAVLCEESNEGYLSNVLNKNSSRRQDVKEYYEYNGSIYLINIQSLLNKGLSSFEKKIKLITPENRSIDIDTELDWIIAEYIQRISKL